MLDMEPYGMTVNLHLTNCRYILYIKFNLLVNWKWVGWSEVLRPKSKNKAKQDKERRYFHDGLEFF